MTYTIKATQLVRYEYEVEAESEEEAREQLQEAIDESNSDLWQASDYEEHDGCGDFGIQSVIARADEMQIKKPEPPEAPPPMFPTK